MAFGQLARVARPALVDGGVGIVMAPRGRVLRVLRVTIADGRINEIEVIGDPGRLAALDCPSGTNLGMRSRNFRPCSGHLPAAAALATIRRR